MSPLVPRCPRGHRHLLLNKDNSFADTLEPIAEFKDLCVLCCRRFLYRRNWLILTVTFRGFKMRTLFLLFTSVCGRFPSYISSTHVSACVRTVIRVGFVRPCIGIAHLHVSSAVSALEHKNFNGIVHGSSSFLMLCLGMVSDETIDRSE